MYWANFNKKSIKTFLLSFIVVKCQSFHIALDVLSTIDP